MEMSTNAVGLTVCVLNDDTLTVTIFSTSYSLGHKVSLPQEPPLYFFEIKRIGKGTFIPVQVMKTYGREEVQLHTFSASALDEGVLSVSRPL
jgi:hypothetical protein